MNNLELNRLANGPELMADYYGEMGGDQRCRSGFHTAWQTDAKFIHRAIQPYLPRGAVGSEYFFAIEVRAIIDEWMKHYNQERPHEALDNLTPVEYLIQNYPEVLTFSCH